MAPYGIVEDCGNVLVMTVQPVIFHDDILAFRKPALAQAFAELGGERHGRVSLSGIDNGDDRQVSCQLPERRKRPTRCRTAEHRNEVASPHGPSITRGRTLP